MIISIKDDVDEVLQLFDGLEVNKDQITKRLTCGLGQGAKTYVKRQYSHYLNKQTGQLYKSIQVGKYNPFFKSVSITSNADSGKKTSKKGDFARYGWMLAHGYTVEAKTPSLLTFQVDGQWVKKQSVTVQPRNFIVEPGEKYMASADANKRLDKELQKQINYWTKRLTGTTHKGYKHT